MTARRLGRTVWHNPASRQHLAPTAVALTTVQHQHHGPVLDQGNLGSCTAHALAQALNTEPLASRQHQLLDERHALAIYSRATSRDPFPLTWPPIDTGSSGNAAAHAARDCRLIRRWGWTFSVGACLRALVLQPVIIGIPWRKDMLEPGPDGMLQVSGPVIGGHEVCLTELDTSSETVTILNSWGPDWGLGGCALLRWTDLAALLADRGDCTVPLV